jgi:putative acetyltransferase
LEAETLIIRQEKPEDFQSIYFLVKIAFQIAKVSNEAEQDYVKKLRVSSNCCFCGW